MREYKVVVVNVMMKKNRGIETINSFIIIKSIGLEYFTIVGFYYLELQIFANCNELSTS